MAVLLISLAGAALGSATLGAGVVALGITGSQIGYFVGGLIGNALFGGQQGGVDSEGPRLNSLKVQTSTYGANLPLIYGKARMTGNVIWSADLRELITETGSGGGGKGGGGGSSTYTSYRYFGNYAIALSEQSAAVLKRWRNNKLVYDRGDNPGFVFYDGSETQLPDPTMEAFLGVGNVPAYRGVSYIVMVDEEVTDVAPSLPNNSFLVLAKAQAIDPITQLDLGGYFIPSNYPVPTDEFPAVKNISGSLLLAHVNVRTGVINQVATLAPLQTDGGFSSEYVSGCYVGTVLADYLGNTVEVFVNELYIATYVNQLQDVFGINATTGSDGRGRILGVSRLITDMHFDYVPFNMKMFIMRANPVAGTYLYCYNYIVNYPAAGTFGIPSLDDWFVDISLAYIVDAELVTSIYDLGRFYVYANNFLILYSGTEVGAGFGVKICDRNTGAVLYTKYDMVGFGTGAQSCFVDTKRNLVVLARYSGANQITIDTISLVGFTFTSKLVSSPDTSSVGHFGEYHEASDRYILTQFGSSGKVISYNPNIGLVEYSSIGSGFIPDSSPFAPVYNQKPIDLGNGYKLIRNHYQPVGGPIYSYKVPMFPSGGGQLAAIVSDISSRVGLSADKIDVSELVDNVSGYIVPNIATARNSIESLMRVYYFDAVESGAKVKFPKRGRSSIVTIEQDDMAVVEYGQPPISPITFNSIQELELPRDVNVTYIDPALDYQQNTQIGKRAITESVNVLNIPVSIVMTATKANEMANVLLYNAWTERNQFEIQLGAKYCWLEPTDVITIPYAGNYQDVRITKKDESNIGIVKLKLSYEDIGTYNQAGNGASNITYIPQQLVAIPKTIGYYLDINALRDIDNNAGIYWVAGPQLSTFTSSALFISYDLGVTYSLVTSTSLTPPIGNTIGTLGPYYGGNTFDTINSLTVYLRSGTLASVSELALLTGANAAVIGSEIIQFKTATLTAPKTYVLTGLLRGRKGTEHLINAHQISDDFIFIDSAIWKSVPIDNSRIGLTNTYKTVSVGLNLESVGTDGFKVTGRRLECYSPVHIGGGLNSDGSISIKWIRRNRLDAQWRDLVDVPMSEVSEAYEIEILSPDLTVKRTITGLTSQTANYQSANIVTDFPNGLPSPMIVSVYQMSGVVGRGYIGRGLVYIGNSPAYKSSANWRLLVTMTDGSIFLSVAKLQFFVDYFLNTDVVGGGIAIANSGVPSQAFDSSLATNWLVSATGDDYIGYMFAEDKKIIGYAITAPTSSLTSSPKAWKLQYKNLGWTTIHEVTGQTGWTANEQRIFKF